MSPSTLLRTVSLSNDKVEWLAIEDWGLPIADFGMRILGIED
jgi:hypothetical protein